jgi:hypothetical protein
MVVAACFPDCHTFTDTWQFCRHTTHDYKYGGVPLTGQHGSMPTENMDE